MLNDKEYYAFISYSHKDEEWAKWLQHEFEHYHLPTTLNGVSNIWNICYSDNRMNVRLLSVGIRKLKMRSKRL